MFTVVVTFTVVATVVHSHEFAPDGLARLGSIDAPLMFVGEAPGADEDAKGEPFVGKAGQLLTKIIQTMGLQRGYV